MTRKIKIIPKNKKLLSNKKIVLPSVKMRIRDYTLFNGELIIHSESNEKPDKNGLYGFYDDLCMIEDNGYGRSEEEVIHEILTFYLNNRNTYKESLRQVCGYIVERLMCDDTYIMTFFEKNNISLEDLDNV